MLMYNETTKEFEEKPLHFQIAGVDKTDEDFLVRIPHQYASLFEGHNFPSRDIFNRALMYAHCAEEAVYYRRPWIVQRDEISLRECLAL